MIKKFERFYVNPARRFLNPLRPNNDAVTLSDGKSIEVPKTRLARVKLCNGEEATIRIKDWMGHTFYITLGNRRNRRAVASLLAKSHPIQEIG